MSSLLATNTSYQTFVIRCISFANASILPHLILLWGSTGQRQQHKSSEKQLLAQKMGTSNSCGCPLGLKTDPEIFWCACEWCYREENCLIFAIVYCVVHNTDSNYWVILCIAMQGCSVGIIVLRAVFVAPIWFQVIFFTLSVIDIAYRRYIFDSIIRYLLLGIIFVVNTFNRDVKLQILL